RAISFGVDINENASGTEKSTSQAVTVEYAWLEVVKNGETKRYGKAPADTTTETGSDFYTETQAWVMKKTDSSRVKMYTLLGRSGSAQITGATTIQNNFDSTLKIVIPDGVDLSGASSAKLYVRLADLKVTLGDPEQFYDFGGGFEDVALLNETDSTFIDTNATKLAPRAEAPGGVILSPEGTSTQEFSNTSTPPALSWIQKPGSGTYNLVAYEDLYPKQGDYDFNDLVVAYSYALGVNSKNEVEHINGQAYILARGSSFTHDWTLTLNLSQFAASVGSSSCETLGYKAYANGTTTSKEPTVDTGGCSVSVANSAGNYYLNWKPFTDTVKLFPASLADRRQAAQPFNTDNYFVPGVKEPKATFSVTFSTPVPLAKFGKEDPWIKITRSDNTTVNVHLSDRDSNNFPFAMLMPTTWKWPIEAPNIPGGNKIGQAYPDFLEFVNSSGTLKTDWHTNPVSTRINNRAQSAWAW
ncbi:MAG: LruC domain-containing protein, partial [Hydrogenophaga sp.]|nr:LruC domain-containing protein [Hydrogenophaga sp.]